MNGDDVGEPSPWVERWLGAATMRGRALDVACGRGRHVRLLRRHGFPVVAVDRDEDALRELAGEPGVECVRSDLEAEPWPFAAESFACVVVTNYLWRPLLPLIVAAVAEGGVLVYETFLVGHERIGRPRNPDFLLRPGELRDAVRGELEVLGFEEGPEGQPPTAMRQRICARRAAGRASGAAAVVREERDRR